MKIIYTIVVILMTMLILSLHGICQDKDVVETLATQGKINWTNGIIQAKGIGAPPDNLYGKPQARPMALRAAEVSAQRTLLETVHGVRIDSSTKVVNLITENDTIKTEVSGILKGAKAVKQEYMSDGTVEVTVEINLHGELAQLVLPKDGKNTDSPKTIIKEAFVSSPENKKTDRLPPISDPEQISSQKRSADTPLLYTGIVIDGRGLNIKPAMAPKILDESGNEIFGVKNVNREIAIRDGMTGYAKNVSAASKDQRVTDHPLTIKGIKAEGPNSSDIIISNADSSTINNTPGILKDCRVIIVLD